MKLSNTAKAMIIIAVFAVALTSAPAAKAVDRGCSDATLRGTYSDQDTGTIVGVGPFAGVNVDSFDGKGPHHYQWNIQPERQRFPRSGNRHVQGEP